MVYQELTNWMLNANYPYVPFLTRAAETGQVLGGIFDSISATVPGCVHNDLLRAGMIPDPYFEMNSLQCAWPEDYWWTYTVSFAAQEKLGRHWRLHMKGMDYKARIIFNGTQLGEHIGMYTPFKADITELLRTGDGENQLSVLLFEAPREMGQIGYTSRTHTQKARFPYKWDFSTRLVQMGLYDQVLIEDFGAAAIEYTKVDAAVADGKGVVRADSELTVFEDGPATVVCRLLYDGQPVAESRRETVLCKGTQTVSAELTVDEPRLWYPNGYGEQPVYTLEVTVEDAAGVSDRQSYQCGFRTMEYLKADGAAAECLPYSVSVNGTRVYIKGVNMVPMDIMYGRIQNETVEHMLRLAKEAHINLIRVWGGGLIESEYFYDLCDRYGLMVWQEFIQSSSGIDNVPSQLPEFMELCRATATHAVRVKQHHPALTFWCGGNELEDANHVPSTFADENVAMLKEIVNRYDGKTFMLPTSATGFFEFLDVGQPGKNYDVHGPWKYDGAEAHYDTFNRSDSQLHSEFGVDGMGNLETIRQVLSPANLKVQNMGNPVWRYHGEMWDTFGRDQSIFGPIAEDRLEDFILSSQFIQAEGIRYAVEANRRRAFSNVGSIIWQFNEPWPNVSCTNLVDYYGRTKLAYYGLAVAFRPYDPSLRYEKLVFAPGEEAKLEAWMTADGAEREWQVSATVTTPDGRVLCEQTPASVCVGQGRAGCAAAWSFTMPESGAVVVTLTAHSGDITVHNRYMLFVRGADGFADRELMLRFARCFEELACCFEESAAE